MYKLLENGVINLETSACIPNCEGNRDWIEYQYWLAQGNTPFSLESVVELVGGVWTDISQSSEYVNTQKQKRKAEINLEYVDKFNAFDIMWSRNFALGRKTAAQYNTARTALAAELATKLAEV